MVEVLDGRSGPDIRTGRPALPRRGRLPGPLALGLASACLLVVALGLLPALAMRPFTVADENAHTSYALQVASGHLPTMRTPTQPLVPGMKRQDTYVANHPPLYYAVVGVPLRLGVAGHRPVAGFLVARLVTLACMAAAVLLLGLLARSALPHRPRVAVAAGALVAATPLFPSTGAQMANDSAAFATVVAVLVAAVALLRRPTRHRLVVLVLACVVAALVRSIGLQASGLAAVAAVVAFARTAPRDRRVLLRAGAAGLAVLLAVAVTSGWFYLRNRHLYGDLLGAKVALALFPAPHLGLDRTLLSGHFWAGQLRQLLTRPIYVVGAVRLWGTVVAAVVGVGLVCLLVRTVPRLRTRPAVGVGLLVGGLLGADLVLGVVDELQYLSVGGLPYVRYALPAFPVLALLAGLALLALPFGRRGPFVVGAVGTLSAISVVVLSKGIAFRHREWARLGILERYRVGLAANGLPAPSVLVALLLVLVVVAVAGVAYSLVRCADRPAVPEGVLT